MFQGLKSHKPEFADELVRLNEKGPPSEPSTYHTCMQITCTSAPTVVMASPSRANWNPTVKCILKWQALCASNQNVENASRGNQS